MILVSDLPSLLPKFECLVDDPGLRSSFSLLPKVEGLVDDPGLAPASLRVVPEEVCDEGFAPHLDTLRTLHC